MTFPTNYASATSRVTPVLRIYVAPALSFVYIMGYCLGRLFASSRGHKGGGRRRRTIAWLTMCRIERLLITQLRTCRDHHYTHAEVEHQSAEDTKGAIPALTTGLLLPSVSLLRVRGDVAASDEPAEGEIIGGRRGLRGSHVVSVWDEVMCYFLTAMNSLLPATSMAYN
ncbi:hypothetical protein DFH94DRAFT_103252 [Russula ochroleuca]|jgi:hypothetical protein|uniref:Uncharacterized protein n=1 Tax=Russula ochroleuca TaxID=152965 RepID=A0A9P5MSC7_9AGAM|nr:hypothetical protein DFH94DRAFT_103252 [Russula ochroleuca]